MTNSPKFPTLGDNYQITNPQLIIPEITSVWKSADIRVASAPTLGTSSGDYTQQIPTFCPTLGTWGVTLIGA